MADPVYRVLLGMIDDGMRWDYASSSARALTHVLRGFDRLAQRTPGVAPSTRELGAELDLAPSTVSHHLKTLTHLGLMERPDERRPRSIRLSPQGRALLAKETT